MRKIEIKKGDRYGILTIIKEIDSLITPNGIKIRVVSCLCDCGKKKDIFFSNLRTGHTTSCNCLRTKRIVIFNKKHHYKKHGMYGTPEYRSWNMMKQRCSNTKNNKYYLYGGRGIKVCKEWEDFSIFYRDMGKRPKGTSIDRIDPNGDYELKNCRWATCLEQNNHLSTTKFLVYNGKKQSVPEWGRELKINPRTIHGRIALGWSIKRILTNIDKK